MIARVMTITGADCNVVMTTCHLTGMAGMISEFLGLSGYCPPEFHQISSTRISSNFIKFHQPEFHQISSKILSTRISSNFIKFHQLQ
jgi:hypothetical protein